jgi:hypothetical protein
MLGSLYLISLVLGGVLLAASLLGDVLDIDAFGSDSPGDLHILTLRGATYFMFVFGAVGAGLTRFAGTPALPALAIAITAGIGTAVLVDRVFRYVSGTDAGVMEADSSLHGLPAEVIVPMGMRQLGKVTLRRGAERLELLAKPFDEREGDPAAWKHVRIIDVRDGTALVSPVQQDPTTLIEEA